MIERKLHKEILNLLKNFPAVAILGARQVGKTTLQSKLQQNKKDHFFTLIWKILWMSGSSLTLTHFLTENKNSFIIIDEVQTIPSLFSILRSVL